MTKLTKKITEGSINVDGKEMNFNEFVQHESERLKGKYEGVEGKVRKKFVLLDVMFEPFKRVLGIIFIITLNISIFTFYLILDTPDWAKVIMTYLILSNVIPYLMAKKKDKNGK